MTISDDILDLNAVVDAGGNPDATISRLKSGHVLRSSGHDRVGDQRMGAPGCHPRQPVMALASELALDVAELGGISIEEAHNIVLLVGVSMQRRLLRGAPSGIPGVGIVGVRQRRGTNYTTADKAVKLSQRIKSQATPDSPINNFVGRSGKGLHKLKAIKSAYVKPSYHIRLEVGPTMTAFYNQNIVWTGTVKSHAAAARLAFQRRRMTYKVVSGREIPLPADRVWINAARTLRLI